MSAAGIAGRGQFLSFTIGGADYAVGILQLREILQYGGVTPVPSAPASVRGVINLRGAVVPVVDLAVKLGGAGTAPGPKACVLIVEASVDGERMVVGIMADGVREVLELGPEEIEPPPDFGALVRGDLLVGMGKVRKGFVLLLDLDRVLSRDDGALPSPPRAASPGAEAAP